MSVREGQVWKQHGTDREVYVTHVDAYSVTFESMGGTQRLRIVRFMFLNLFTLILDPPLQ